MYIIFPLSGFIRDSCTNVLHRPARVAALSLWFHPLAVDNTAELAIQEEPQMFLLMPFGWVKKQQQLKFRQEESGRSEPRAIRACVRVCAAQHCRAARLISRKHYLLFASNIMER